ncbi:MAG: SLBB domain-containing protein [Burkholderiales bacterium]|jgi:protein involved in polysaccharide export with SLBB domain
MSLLSPKRTSFRRLWLGVLTSCFLGVAIDAVAQAAPSQEVQAVGGPVKLSGPQAIKGKPGSTDKIKRNPNEDLTVRETTEIRVREQGVMVREAWIPSEFELYVSRLASADRKGANSPNDITVPVRRFGADLLWSGVAGSEFDESNAVPEDYLVGPGDELIVDLWGGVEGNLRLKVSRSGSINIPRVGTVAVAGVRFADLPKLLRQRVGQNFRQFDLAVSMGELRTMRVFVTGFVARPGLHVVPSLSSLTQALAVAGGPTAIGSFRTLQLRRNGQLVETLDLYELLLRGQLGVDRRLQSGDVIHVPAVGPQVAVIGSVNNQAVFELRGDEVLDDLLRMAGGLAPVANRDVAVVLALGNSMPVREVQLSKDVRTQLRAGEVLRVSSLADVSRPSLASQKRVRVDGEVSRPGDYVLPAGATLRDAVTAAGGLTPEAFLFGSEFKRESVLKEQGKAYERTLSELEAEFARSSVSRNGRVGPLSDGEKPPQITEYGRLIERLRKVKPVGRVVLQLKPSDKEVPAIPLEDGDSLSVPAKAQSVSVYGSVFNTGSYLYGSERSLAHYLKQAGGPTRNADEEGVFVLRADGSVISNRASGGSGWWSSDTVQRLTALPGDTIFVPEQMDKITWTQSLRDWTQILSQFGLGAIALKNFNK